MKTALVSGASGGIGLSITKKLILDGYFVVALYNKNIKPLEELGNELIKEGFGGYLSCYKIDFNDSESVESGLKQIDKTFHHFDLLVVNAGIDLYKSIIDTSEDEYDMVFNINTKQAFTLSKYVLNRMLSRKSGSIIYISSIWGSVGGSMESIYSASKSALIGLTKALSKEVGTSGIRVNCICPGVIDTKINAIFSEKDMHALKEATPLKRIGKPEEVAEMVLFLASEKAGFITGEVITIDGGYTL